MQLNKFFRERFSSRDKLLWIVLTVLWGILVYIWMVSDQNAKGLDGIYRLISSIQSQKFELRFGLSYIVILAAVSFKIPTVPELQRLKNNQLLNQFIIKSSFIPTMVVLLGAILSLGILLCTPGQLNIDVNNLFVGTLVLVLYICGVYIICLVVNILILMSNKLMAILGLAGFLVFDYILNSMVGFDLLLNRGITWTSGVYDYQIIVNFVLYLLYVFLIVYNMNDIFRKSLFR